MIVAIDGPAGSGKSTTARCVADSIDFLYLDTGAMYRAATAAVLSNSIDIRDENAVELCTDSIEIDFDESGSRVFLNGVDISSEIRGQVVTDNVSAVSALFIVREKMVELQRKIAGNRNSVVEGRDIGTVVFPNADFKFFMFADITERAKRRHKDLVRLGINRTVEDIVQDLKQRDKLDSTRAVSPLMKAKGAIEIDTTAMTIHEQINLIVSHVMERSVRKEK